MNLWEDGASLDSKEDDSMDSRADVAVVRWRGEFSLVAAADISEGEFLFRIEGERTATPTRYSVQLDEMTHIDLGVHPLETLLDRYYWRFMNHHCEPSAVVRGQDVFAARSLRAWDEITFDYNTTEYRMAEAFPCRCGSVHCPGQIQGFQALSPARQRALRPALAPYLLRLLHENE